MSAAAVGCDPQMGTLRRSWKFRLMRGVG